MTTIYIFFDANGNQFDQTSDWEQAQSLTERYRVLRGGGEWRAIRQQQPVYTPSELMADLVAWINAGCPQEVVGI